MKNLKLTFLTLAFATFLVSCSKDGATGPAGANGATGATGNANVEIFTFNVDNSSWIADSANLQWSTDYTLPSSANVSGGVFLYIKDGGNWAALPHVDYGQTFEFGYDPTTRIVEVQSADATAMTMIPNPGPDTFRVVCIPPAGRIANPNLDYKNYNEIQSTFHLKK